jgi:8-oxo-dGTP diphosphatase
MNKCARGIIILNNHILLIKRIKNNHLYHVFPGGHCLENEEDKRTCIREVKEETNLDIEPVKKVKVVEESSSFETVFFLCKLDSKPDSMHKLPKLTIIGIEKDRNNKNNYYKPIWVQLKQIDNMVIYPKVVVDYISANFIK